MPKKIYKELFHDGPACLVCRHLTKVGKQDNTGWKCKAFPKGISGRIVSREVPHNVPQPYDDGIIFEGETVEHDGKKFVYRWSGGTDLIEDGQAHNS